MSGVLFFSRARQSHVFFRSVPSCTDSERSGADDSDRGPQQSMQQKARKSTPFPPPPTAVRRRCAQAVRARVDKAFSRDSRVWVWRSLPHKTGADDRTRTQTGLTGAMLTRGVCLRHATCPFRPTPVCVVRLLWCGATKVGGRTIGLVRMIPRLKPL